MKAWILRNSSISWNRKTYLRFRLLWLLRIFIASFSLREVERGRHYVIIYHLAMLKGLQESDGLSYENPGEHLINWGLLFLQTTTLVHASLSWCTSPFWHGVFISSGGTTWNIVHVFDKLDVSDISVDWLSDCWLSACRSCLCLSLSLSSWIAGCRWCHRSVSVLFSQGLG
jgi:hypothetical protein